MTIATLKCYVFRSAPVVIFGCLAAAIIGAELGGAALETAPRLFAGKAVARGFQYGSVADELYGMAFWNLFLAPVLLFGFVLFGWPALVAVRRWRPSWFGPKLIYVMGILAVTIPLLIESIWMISYGTLHNVSLETILRVLLSEATLGCVLGLPAAVVFRLIALRTGQKP